MKVGLLAPQGWKNEYDGWDPRAAWERTLELAAHAEARGFEALWVFDHFTTVPDPTDEMKNTRTTTARWWERLLIAPNCVNFHLEHHLLPTVPYFRLPALGRALAARGAMPSTSTATGYVAVLRGAASR